MSSKKGSKLTIPTHTISFDKGEKVDIDVIVRFGRRIYLYYEKEPLGYIRHYEHSWYNEELESRLEELGVDILINGDKEKDEPYDLPEPQKPPLAVCVEQGVYSDKMAESLLTSDAGVGEQMLHDNPYYSE